MHIFPKFHRRGWKIVPAMPFRNLNFNWAWQAQFLSHNLLSLQNCLFFTNKEMMLMSFFEINDGIWDKNFACHCHIHFLSHPWVIQQEWMWIHSKIARCDSMPRNTEAKAKQSPNKSLAKAMQRPSKRQAKQT